MSTEGGILYGQWKAIEWILFDGYNGGAKITLNRYYNSEDATCGANLSSSSIYGSCSYTWDHQYTLVSNTYDFSGFNYICWNYKAGVDGHFDFYLGSFYGDLRGVTSGTVTKCFDISSYDMSSSSINIFNKMSGNYIYKIWLTNTTS